MSDEQSTEVHPRSVRITLDQVVLTVLDGPERGHSVRLPVGSARIGKASGCHVRLGDPSVSRVHCEVRVTRTGVRIVDRNSTNGTVVNGVRVYEAELRDGATIHIGASTLRVSLDRGRAEVTLAPMDRFGALLGGCPEMRAIYALIPLVAQSQTSTLIQGETGTGKELLARAIHASSPRAAKPFVVLDCAGVSPGVIESDLFGHVRGSFTGAVNDREGLFEAADGGTIFIDEVTELPKSLQPRLLRVLEARELRRMGSNTMINVDVHVIAAASRPLADCVNDGSFRDDLFYRLAVAEMFLPPLRARGDDALQIAREFWQRAAPDQEMPAELLPAIRSRSFPGNVRELRNFVERVAKLGWGAAYNGAPLQRDADPGVAVDLPLRDARRVWNKRFEEVYANALLVRAGGNVTRAAELAGVNRRSFQRMLAKASADESDTDDAGDSE